jgi:hypothetical protein
MPLDQTAIGELAASLMDRIELAMGDEGTIGAVGLIVEGIGPDGGSQIFTMFNDARFHIRLGMLDLARAAVQRELDA